MDSTQSTSLYRLITGIVLLVVSGASVAQSTRAVDTRVVSRATSLPTTSQVGTTFTWLGWEDVQSVPTRFEYLRPDSDRFEDFGPLDPGDTCRIPGKPLALRFVPASARFAPYTLFLTANTRLDPLLTPACANGELAFCAMTLDQ